MKVLNLRNVPDELMRELRAEAALANVPFHTFCVGLLESAMYSRRVPVVVQVKDRAEAERVVREHPAPQGIIVIDKEHLTAPENLEIEIT